MIEYELNGKKYVRMEEIINGEKVEIIRRWCEEHQEYEVISGVGDSCAWSVGDPHLLVKIHE